MIVRIWRTEIDETRAGDYIDFARERSLPMFRQQAGFGGVLFVADRGERIVITLWRDLASVAALEDSSSYRATVAEIEATGFITGRSSVEVFELDDIFLEVDTISDRPPPDAA